MSVLSNDLLDQAKHLQGLDPGKPKQANLRRAVSTAYYSLFHLLIDEATQLVVATKFESRELRFLTARCFEHGSMKGACQEFIKTTPRDVFKPMWAKLQLSQAPRDPLALKLTKVALAFVRLQEERHRADYDLSASFTRASVVANVEQVEKATQNWRDVRSGDAELAQFFALLLLCWKSWERR